MCMLYDPLFHFYAEPEAVNTESYKSQQKPFDIVSEKLSACAVKQEAMTVNYRMFSYPFFFYTYSKTLTV